MTREQEPFNSVAEGRSELGRWIVEALSNQGYDTNVTTRLLSDGVMQVQIGRGGHTRGFTISDFKKLSPPTSTGMRATRGGALPGGGVLTPSPG